MTKGPRGEKPADVIGAPIKITRNAIGGETEKLPSESAGAQLGKLGGAARARKLTPQQRQEIARKGAAKRWEGR